MNDFFYGEGDLYAVAAAYAFHLAQNQAYLDGNKRTATASAMVFLWMNGITHPLDRECRWKIYDALIAIAEHRMTKPELAALFRKFFTTQKPGADTVAFSTSVRLRRRMPSAISVIISSISNRKWLPGRKSLGAICFTRSAWVLSW